MPAKPIKVLFLPKWYPDRNDPQNGVFIRKHAQAVSGYCDVKVLRVSRDLNLSSKYEIEKGDLSPEELFSYYRPNTSKIKWLRKITNFIKYYKAFNKGWRVFKQKGWEPDIIHVHVMVRPGLIAYLKNWPISKPYLISEHSSEYLNGRFAAHNGFFKALNFRIFWKAKAVTAVSQHLANGMKALGLPGNIRVIPNVIDMPEIRSNEIHARIRVMTVADLVDDIKNISGIIRAVGALMNEGSDIEYHIVGGGPDIDELKELAEKECPEGRVTFYGRVDNETALDKISSADVVVINSRVETFALVVAEAIAMGKPVIATRCGGPEMFVNEETGILVDVDDELQLKDAIQIVLGTLDSYEPVKMRASLGERYSRKAIGEQFFGIYREIMSNN